MIFNNYFVDNIPLRNEKPRKNIATRNFLGIVFKWTFASNLSDFQIPGRKCLNLTEMIQYMNIPVCENILWSANL